MLVLVMGLFLLLELLLWESSMTIYSLLPLCQSLELSLHPWQHFSPWQVKER
jgi:hypothetical protein